MGNRALVIGYEDIQEVSIERYDEICDAVEGGIELFNIPLIEGVDLYVNVDGLSVQYPNRAIRANKAMEEMGYYRQLTLPGYIGETVKTGEIYTVLYGPILAIGFNSETGENVSLSDEQVLAVRHAFRNNGPMGPASGLAVTFVVKQMMEAEG